MLESKHLWDQDWFRVTLLMLIAVGIYYPVFYSHYAYTDELTGLWMFRTDNEHTLIQYGRLITEKLAVVLFGHAKTIDDLSSIRIFSFCGWLLSIPVWFTIIKRIAIKENLPQQIAFLATLYLICSPPVTSSIAWAACFEMFLANTAGLLSGYFLYSAIRYKEGRVEMTSGYFLIAVITGLISLFTYQNCFGCFLLPFLLHLIAQTKISRKISIGVGIYLFIYVVYYLAFKYTLKTYHLPVSDRTGIHINIPDKFIHFFAQPLNSAFHFTMLFNEKSIAGFIVYVVIAGTWLILSFLQRASYTVSERIRYFAMVFCFLGMIYLPSLIVKENYASNRTLLPIDIAVFLLVAQTILVTIKTTKWKYNAVIFMTIFFAANAWYNLNRQFIQPVQTEYNQLRSFVDNHYHKGIDTVYFIRPHEDFFVKKYELTRTWDEFGVPSTFFGWTPAFLIKAIVFEKTGDRNVADKIVTKSWLGKETYDTANVVLSPNILVMDTEEIMSGP